MKFERWNTSILPPQPLTDTTTWFGVGMLWGLRPARPGRARLGMTLEPLVGSTAIYRNIYTYIHIYIYIERARESRGEYPLGDARPARSTVDGRSHARDVREGEGVGVGRPA